MTDSQDSEKKKHKPPDGRFFGPENYFNAVHQAFFSALHGSDRWADWKFQIVGQKIQLRIAGSNLSSGMTRALKHLPGWVTGEPNLTLGIWDSAESGVDFPQPPWAGRLYRARGKEFKYEEGSVHYYDGRLRMFFYQDEHVMLLDRQKGIGIFWLPDASQLPYYECGAPLRMLFHWWLSDARRQFVHGAAVGIPEGGVLIAGKSGSGKSTCTLACLDSPLKIAGDDYCLLEVEPEPRIYSLYCTAKIDPTTLYRFPALETRISNALRLETEKALFFIQQHFPDKILLDFPIRALLIPRVTGRRDTQLEHARPAEALKALAPSTIIQLSDEGQSALQVLTRFVQRIPCYNLKVGTDLKQIPETILDVLSRQI